MPHWVECTAVGGQTIFVNLSLVVSISRTEPHTTLTYSGEDGGAMAVIDKPEDILAQPNLGRLQGA